MSGGPPIEQYRRGRGLIDNMAGSWNNENLRIVGSTIREDTPNHRNIAGVRGGQFELNNSWIQGQVDSVQIQGDDVWVRASLLENTVHYAADDYWSDASGTHNDNVQILYGDNITISGNTIRGAQDLAIIARPEGGSMLDLVIRDNLLVEPTASAPAPDPRGNGWGIKVAETPARMGGPYPYTAQVFDNTFVSNGYIEHYVIVREQMDDDHRVSLWDNVLTFPGTNQPYVPVPVERY